MTLLQKASVGILMGLLALPAWADLWTLLPAEPSLPGTAASNSGSGNAPASRLGRHQTARLDPLALENLLFRAPQENAGGGIIIQLPTPDGAFERFTVTESSIMEPGLQQWFDDQGWPMRTYAGHNEETGSSVRLDWGGPNGFHAIVSGTGGTWFVDPVTPGDMSLYAAYDKRENIATVPLRCEGGQVVNESNLLHAAPPDAGAQAGASTNGNLRTYRLAFAVTGDYTTNLAGGSVVTAQSNVVTIVNRINQTYERELSVRFIVIADNADLIYTDESTDPYTTASPSTMLGENQSNINAVIGAGDYDIGHVMYNGGSGIAQLGVPCNNGSKARGVSGVFQATGDSIVVDMIAHELGHQFNAGHTFNSPLGNCSGQRSNTEALEPGSGTTIMSYTGICNADNIQTFSDDYFHGVSLDRMLDFVAGGGSCATQVPTTNNSAPVLSASGGFTLPIDTPFELAVDSATDGDGDGLTYTWEQFDLGPAATLAAGDQGNNAIIRSLPPGIESTRVVTGEAFGELLPTTTRALNFRVTARDNHPDGGRIGEANISLNTTTAAGPFAITTPNGGEDISSGELLTVSWDVAGTNSGAINADLVDILLSTNGGETFDTVLVTGVVNDGEQDVALPAVSSANARIRIKPQGNIFFAQSADNFRLNALEQCVEPGTDWSDNTPVTADIVIAGQPGNVSDLNARLAVTHPFTGVLAATLTHLETATEIELMSRPGVDEDINPSDFGCPGSNVDALFDDEATSEAENACVSANPGLSGSVIPDEALAAFNGESINGTWRVRVFQRNFTVGGTKTLDRFCIQVPLSAEAPPPPPGPEVIIKSGFEDGEVVP